MFIILKDFIGEIYSKRYIDLIRSKSNFWKHVDGKLIYNNNP